MLEIVTSHPIVSIIILFLFWCLIEGKLPEDKEEFKVITKIIKKFVNIIMADIVKDFNEKIDSIQKDSKDNFSRIEQNIQQIDDNRKEDSLVTMRDRLTQLYHYYQPKGYILEEDKKNFNSIYVRYVQNGGNSFIQDDVAPVIQSLPRFMSHGDAERFFEEHGHYNNGTENK